LALFAGGPLSSEPGTFTAPLATGVIGDVISSSANRLGLIFLPLRLTISVVGGCITSEVATAGVTGTDDTPEAELIESLLDKVLGRFDLEFWNKLN